MPNNPVAVARASYRAYVDKDRAAIEALISDDFHFTSPLDNRIDRETYFARCWPNSAAIAGFELVRLVREGEVRTRHLRRAKRERQGLPQHRNPDGAERPDRRGRGLF